MLYKNALKMHDGQGGRLPPPASGYNKRNVTRSSIFANNKHSEKES